MPVCTDRSAGEIFTDWIAEETLHEGRVSTNTAYRFLYLTNLNKMESTEQIAVCPVLFCYGLPFLLVRFSVSVLSFLPALLVSVFTDGTHINIIVEFHICVTDAAEKCAAKEVLAV